MERFSFGNTPALADSLLALVLSGRKTATSWAAVHGPCNSEAGKRQIILDSKGKQRVLIETLDLKLIRFQDVDASFAHAEGEGDLSLGQWQKGHRAYFENEGTYTDDMLIYCQRFRVVEIFKDHSRMVNGSPA